MSNKASTNTEPSKLESIGEDLYSQFSILGSNLRDQLQAAIYDGNQYHVAVKDSDGKVVVRIPLNVGLLVALPCLMIRSLRWTVILFAALLFAQSHLTLEAPDQAETQQAETTAARKHTNENGTKSKVAKAVDALKE